MVLQEIDVKNFVRECFHDRLDNEDLFNNAELMNILFHKRDLEVIQNYFSANPDLL